MICRIIVCSGLMWTDVCCERKKLKNHCTIGESNPGQVLGRRLCYHYTNGALCLFLHYVLCRAVLDFLPTHSPLPSSYQPVDLPHSFIISLHSSHSPTKSKTYHTTTPIHIHIHYILFTTANCNNKQSPTFLHFKPPHHHHPSSPLSSCFFNSSFMLH